MPRRRQRANNRDSYIPRENRPHIHIHRGGVDFTDVDGSHKYLERGDRVYMNNVHEVLSYLEGQGGDGSARYGDIYRWIREHYI